MTGAQLLTNNITGNSKIAIVEKGAKPTVKTNNS